MCAGRPLHTVACRAARAPVRSAIPSCPRRTPSREICSLRRRACTADTRRGPWRGPPRRHLRAHEQPPLLGSSPHLHYVHPPYVLPISSRTLLRPLSLSLTTLPLSPPRGLP